MTADELREALASSDAEVVNIEKVLIDSSRARPGVRKPASVRLAVPDEAVIGIRGRRPMRDVYLLVKVPLVSVSEEVPDGE